ncbi:redox-regulated ATPase YchF [Methanosalsum natronophilum]|uniref:redox-regulated ATPase YchF n=1 Tax=Methanosalsum natronophilum TaxID=768733 RepID=UPI002168C0AD|nr:redox-regulated ATPase YchF [Methanosalsum natronophilum]MCS3924251.1 ribosome-binding ATPase YchF (GTP1/OBG family) [Methanosalsum natronophilum]
MSITIGLAGKPNAGKSTFFKASTLADIEIANYPFTTIDANRGVGYVSTACPCNETETQCSNCVDEQRYVPIEIIDVAGLVPDAHKGRGLGNKFLDELRQASAIIHVVDSSGGTDQEGNPVDVGTHDPVEDIYFLNKELNMWLFGILKRNWDRISRKIKAENLKASLVLSDQLAGAGINEEDVNETLVKLKLNKDCTKWEDGDLLELCNNMRILSKPMIIALNKVDVAPEQNLLRIREMDILNIGTSAAAELALRSASLNKIIDYKPGSSNFKLISENISTSQKKALDSINDFLQKYGSTGIQETINKTVFELLDMIVVYPVEDEKKWTDKDGNMLPDAFLMKKGSNAHDLAYKVHSDIGDSFLYAIDARTRMRLGEKHELKNNDVIKIVSTAK